MELNEHGLLQEFIAARRETWADLGDNGVHDLSFQIQNQWSFDCLDEIQVLPSSNPHWVEPISQPSSIEFPFSMGLDEHLPFFEGLIAQEDNYPPSNNDHHQEDNNGSCKMEMEEISRDINQVLKKGKVKKLQGQPSKNLMAERRRRKRLNERLSMLRSIVPKITKMDRTSILADAIDYMKELLDRINRLKEEERENSMKKTKLIQGLRQLNANETLLRNSPKLEVERRESDTWIDLNCAAKPGLLMSTVTTLETLGLEIQQCVISCFSDFSFQASCSETAEQRKHRRYEDLKEALLRNVEYGVSFL